MIPPGALPTAGATTRADAPLRIAFVDREERPALRAFLRGLRAVPLELDWEAVVLTARGASSSTPLRSARARAAALRRRPTSSTSASCWPPRDVVVAASDGAAPNPGILLRARAAGAVPVASRLPVYEEVLGEGEPACCSSPTTSRRSTAQLTRVLVRRRAARAPGGRPAAADPVGR